MEKDLKTYLIETLNLNEKKNEKLQEELVPEVIESEEDIDDDSEIDNPSENKTIKNEEDFRSYVENKFKEVFGDKLDVEKMNNIINGILKDNEEAVKNNEWGELVGILNKSFGS